MSGRAAQYTEPTSSSRSACNAVFIVSHIAIATFNTLITRCIFSYYYATLVPARPLKWSLTCTHKC